MSKQEKGLVGFTAIWLFISLTVLVLLFSTVLPKTGFEFAGTDADVMTNAGKMMWAKGELYPLIPWTQINPEAPYLNNRYGLLTTFTFGLLSFLPEPVLKVLLLLTMASCYFAAVYVFKLLLNLINLKLQVWHTVVILLSTSVLGNFTFLNIEPLVILAAMALLYVLCTQKFLVVGALALVLIFDTKLQWLALLTLALLLFKDKANTLFLIRLVMCAVLIWLFGHVILSLALGPDYVFNQTLGRFAFLAKAPELMPWWYPVPSGIATNSIYQVAIRYLGPTPIAFASILAFIALITAWVVTAIYVAFKKIYKSSWPTQRITLAITCAFLVWCYGQVLLWQLEYNGLAVFIVVLVCLRSQSKLRYGVLLNLGYTLSQFGVLLWLGLPMAFPFVLASLLVCIWQLGLMIWVEPIR